MFHLPYRFGLSVVKIINFLRTLRIKDQIGCVDLIEWNKFVMFFFDDLYFRVFDS